MAEPAPCGIERQSLRVLVDGLPDAAVVVDDKLRPLAWNQLYTQTVGAGGKRLSRRVANPEVRCRDLYGLEICDSDCLATRAFATGRPVRLDEIHGRSCRRGQVGSDILIVTSIPLLNGQQEVVAVLEIYRDVTAEARIQKRYKALLDNERHRAEILEMEVQARTADLQRSLEELRATRAQLIQSEKLSSLGRMVAGIAHEINNPVNFIFGNIDFLQTHVEAIRSVIEAYETVEPSPSVASLIEQTKKEVDYDYVCEDIDKLLKSIRLGAERTAAIVRDLRSVCHTSGEEMAPVDVPTCVERTLSLLGHATRERIDIIRDFPEKAPPVWGNEGRINQVFMNIIMNAIQAIPEKGSIRIAVTEEDDGVMVRIADNGMGMSEDVQLKIFDPFFTTKPVGEGTGLGLSITYSIIDAHNGKISVESAPGEGSTFSIWLPRTSAENSGSSVCSLKVG